ncbi:PUA domain-containing protein [Methanocella sp. MCL-LM]|uniref:PUA domain-containing protein n=1 Tax=Methanocella sp. MCL-LM TaxID=3412035 RepID=UPI003C711AAD
MYRGLKKNELTLVRRGLDYWGAFDLSKDLNLVAKQGDKVEIFVTTPEVKFFAIGRDPEPMTAGLCIGEVGKKQFLPTLEGLYLIARASEKKKVEVVGQAESLVLYGRDVFGTSITWADESIRQNERVIIANKFGEAIGVGRARYDYSGLMADKVTVTNEADVGLYIRNQDIMAGSTCRLEF